MIVVTAEMAPIAMLNQNLPARRKRNGFILLTAAAMAVVLIAFAGLVIDVGLMRYWRRQAQNAADMAAVAAIIEEGKYGSGGDYNDAAQRVATANGITAGTNGVSVAINNPPSVSSRYSGRTGFAEAVVSKQLPLSFMSILGLRSATVTARAVAGFSKGDACVIALRASGDGTFNAGGSSIFDTACGIVVNSTGAKAFTVGNSACVKATSISVAGGTGGTTFNTNGTCPGASPTAVTSAPPIDDPFATLPKPTIPSSCDYSGYKLTGGSVTINPGRYCNGISLQGGTLNMNPGVYILDGGSLTVNAGTTLIGTGVTFYLTGGATLKMNGTATQQLRAPTSGTYEGILFYGDPTGATAGQTISGNNNSWVEGTIYFPSATVTFTGNSSYAAYTILVAETISITGNGSFNNDYSGLDNGSPIKTKGGITVE